MGIARSRVAFAHDEGQEFGAWWELVDDRWALPTHAVEKRVS